MSMNASPQERFDRAYEADANSGCWLWSGVTLSSGYGQIRVQNRKWLAHRLSWSLNKGLLPAGALVLHRCDVRSCVNPDHLFLGDHRDNIVDCIQKGRYKNLGGETAPNKKLSWTQVAAIQEALARGDTQQSIADKHRVSRSNISAIKRGVSWTQNANARAAERVR